MRTAFAEMRRRKWRDVYLEEAIIGREESVPDAMLTGPERVATQRTIMEEVARHMGTNRNALYKLLHDARKRLKWRMLAERLLPQDVFSVFEG